MKPTATAIIHVFLLNCQDNTQHASTVHLGKARNPVKCHRSIAVISFVNPIKNTPFFDVLLHFGSQAWANESCMIAKKNSKPYHAAASPQSASLAKQQAEGTPEHSVERLPSPGR
jgi:hypothetical protein